MVTKKKGSAKTLLITQEIGLVKLLCDNDQKVRDGGLRKLTRWLTSRSQGSIELVENDFNRLWKGLFYCVWMADKPLYQEEAVEFISKIVHCFTDNHDMAMAFIKSFFYIMGREWPGIDNLRMDKCMMLVRRIVRQSFFILSNDNWNCNLVDKLASCYKTSLDHIPDGLICHLSDIYINELSKVGDGKLSTKIVVDLVRPFAEYISILTDGRLITRISSSIFLNLIRLSEKAVEHESRFKAWRDRGFPGGSIEVIKKVDTDDNNTDDSEDEEVGDDVNKEDNDKVFDPRAGLVDVELPIVIFDPQQFIDLFKSLKMNKNTTTKARKQIDLLIRKFTVLSSGKYPLGLQKFETLNNVKWKTVRRKATQELIKCQENDYDMKEEENANYNSFSKLSSNGIETPGVWQVTPIKQEKRNRNKKKLNSIIVDSSLMNKLPSSNWIVVDKRKDKDNGADNSSINFNNKREKTNDLTNSAAVNINGVQLNNIKPNHEDLSTCDDDCDTEIVIKQQRSRKRKRKNSITINGGSSTVKEADGSTLSSISTPPSASLGIAMTPDMSCSLNSTDPSSMITNSSNFSSPLKKRKRVSFYLCKNTVQEEREYQRLIKNQPIIQFDKEKQPVQPIYKDKGVRSPVNPFYKNLGFTSL